MRVYLAACQPVSEGDGIMTGLLDELAEIECRDARSDDLVLELAEMLTQELLDAPGEAAAGGGDGVCLG